MAREKWEAPAFEVMRVSAEAAAYMGTWDLDGDISWP
jgi:hypothetical protein